MQKICVVILVSAQTVPNVQFLKWFLKNNFQTGLELIFVSTKAMEKLQKSEAIWNALDEKQKFFSERKTVLLDENDMADVQKNLSQTEDFSSFEKVAVSITGGTKLMSISAFVFFSKLNNSEIFYQPISDKLQELSPEQKNIPDVENLTLKEYFTAFNMNFKFDCKCVKTWDYNQNVYDSLIKENHETIKKMLQFQNDSWFRNIYKRKDSLDFTQIEDSKFENSGLLKSDKEEICGLLEKCGFDIHNIKNDDFRYLTGGWFEEFVFQKIKEEQHLEEGKNLALNVTIESLSDAKNELDVVYVDPKNTLHIIECKSFIDQKSQGDLLNITIYKAQALKSKFGLTVKSHLYTMSVIDKDSVLNRAKDFGIEIVDGRKLCEKLSYF